MGYELNYTTIIAYGFGILMLYLLIRFFYLPLKYFLRFAFKVVAGGVVLFVVNLIGGFFGFILPINLVSAAAVGFLGVPGLGLLLVLKYWMMA